MKVLIVAHTNPLLASEDTLTCRSTLIFVPFAISLCKVLGSPRLAAAAQAHCFLLSYFHSDPLVQLMIAAHLSGD